jgi:MscS family membrane protein
MMASAFPLRPTNLSRPLFALVASLLLWLPAMVTAQATDPIPAARPAPPAAASSQPATSQTAGEEAAGARDSPRAALRQFFVATRAGHWNDAARYLSLDEEQRPRGAQLARRLKAIIDGHHWIELEAISADSRGRLDDGLPADLEEVNRFSVEGREERMRMVRTSDAQGAYWAFSPRTVARIDTWYVQLPDHWLRDAIVYADLDVLLLPGPFELLWWQWCAVPILALVAWALGGVLGRLTRALLIRIAARTSNVWDDQLARTIGRPLTLGWALGLFWLGAQALVLTDPAYRALDAVVTAGVMVALFWALWRSTHVMSDRLIARPWAEQNASARTLIAVGSNFARGAILGLGALAVLSAVGYPVGTVLAGLGIGGLAFAFGAQKTIENLFGSVSLAVDQPFRVGDFVKVEDFVGTVENIGMRSTRFRTLDRTLVSIPNGKLSEQRLESFQVRDRMRLAMTLGLTYGTTHQQMQAVLEGLERVLRDHPKIWPDAVVVKFKEFGASSLDIEVMAWFQVPTWAEFQACRQEVLLRFMRIVEESGSSFAFPTRTVHLVQETATAQAA